MTLGAVLVVLVAACLGAALSAVLPGAGARLGALRRRTRLTRGGRRPLQKLAGAEGGTVYIEGALRAREGDARVLVATAVPPEDAADVPGSKALCAAAREVWLDLPDGAALLEGEAVVVSGSIEIAPGQPAEVVGRDLGEMCAELCSVGKWQVRCLQKGDRVRALARVERAPDLDGPSGYRKSASLYRLLPASGRRSVEMAAVRAPSPFVPRRRRIVAAAVGALVAVPVGLVSLSVLLPKVPRPEPVPKPISMELHMKLEEHRYEEAADLAEGTQHHEIAARASFMAGRLPAAARLFAAARKEAPIRPTWTELDAYLAAHRYEDAARIADELAERNAGGAIACFARALHFKAGDPRPLPDPFEDKIDSSLAALCALASADAGGTGPFRRRLQGMVSDAEVRRRGPGSAEAPSARDMDARVAALLLLESGDLARWPFQLPHGAHVLRVEGPYFTMPLLQLEASASFAGSGRGGDRARELEQAVMKAVWCSYLGDHDLAARDFREALRSARLDPAAPEPQAHLGHRFEIRNVHRALYDILAKKNPDAATLMAIGAALSLRAREADHAAEYVGLFPAEADPTRIRNYLYTIESGGADASARLGDIESPVRMKLLRAGLADDDSDLRAALRETDGQGLWPIFGPKLSHATSAREWVKGGRPVRWEDLGYYGVLSFWAARRAAAQSIDTGAEDRTIVQRIGQLRTHLHDRKIDVLLYVSGRLARGS